MSYVKLALCTYLLSGIFMVFSAFCLNKLLWFNLNFAAGKVLL